jgi:hypothetical protein
VKWCSDIIKSGHIKLPTSRKNKRPKQNGVEKQTLTRKIQNGRRIQYSSRMEKRKAKFMEIKNPWFVRDEKI